MNENGDRPASALDEAGSRILLVDDRNENLLALEAVLKPLHQEIVCARSGEDALAALLASEFAVALIDVRMPGMDGFETAAHIKRRDRTRHLPIIFLTAVEDDIETALRGYSEGAVDYLTKPFNPHVLRSKVAVFVELHLKNRLLAAQARQLERSNAELAALAEAAEEASRAKTSFLNMIGHELRTPLTVIGGYAAMLNAGDFGEVSALMGRPLRVLEEKTEELAELVDALLAAAQIESGQIPARPERVDLSVITRQAVGRLEARAALHHADVELDGGDRPVMIDADPGHLARVLDNLLNNALSYGGTDPWIRVRVEADGESARVEVEDHGIGVPDAMRERIFERFVRGSEAGMGTPGSGLGLYVCRELIERAGGRLELAASEVGQGSRFVVHLPRAAERRRAGVARSDRSIKRVADPAAEPPATERVTAQDAGAAPGPPATAVAGQANSSPASG